jgi:NADH-quinone oxidoreductase subunit K
MTQTTLEYYLAVGGLLFVIGLIGFMVRRNLIVMFLCTELMFQGAASLALGLVVLLFRRKNTLDADAWRGMRG